MKKILEKNKKQFLILILCIIIVIFIVTLIIFSKKIFHKNYDNIEINDNNFEEIKNPQLDPNYEGYYDQSSGLLKTVDLFDGKDITINDCVFSNLKFSSSPRNSSFSGLFKSNNDKIVGTVVINIKLLDSEKNVIKDFENKLFNVNKGEEYIILGEYNEDLSNVTDVEITIN